MNIDIAIALRSFLIIGLLFKFAITLPASSFQFPKIKFIGITKYKGKEFNAPQKIIQSGPEKAENLRRKLEKHCGIAPVDGISAASEIRLCWEPRLRESYDVADAIFREVARASLKDSNGGECVFPIGDDALRELILSFPSMSRPDDLGELAEVLQSEKPRRLLGLENAYAELYPSSPCPYLRIKFPSPSEAYRENQCDSNLSTIISAKYATENWVNNFLGKYALCPYTSCVSRAAVGLSLVGIPVGGVHVRVISSDADRFKKQSHETQRARELVSAFWSEVVTLMSSTQEEWATSLVVFTEYDADFESFIDVCDGVVEPAVTAMQSTKHIGRAWFHPLYDADTIGHSDVTAGHAVPHKMVYRFMKSLYSSMGKGISGPLEFDALSKANNMVRQTPHATINILRRAQLTAAAEYERNLGEKRPKANSVYVRNAMRLTEVLKKSKSIDVTPPKE